MALYMRYITTDPREVTLRTLEEALQSVDPTYHVEGNGQRAKLMVSDGTYGRLEVDRPGDEDFGGEIQDLRTALNELPEQETKTVRNVLHHAESLVVLQVIWENRDDETTLTRIRPLWDWLLRNRTGLLQVDEQGYYSINGLILAVPT